MNIDQIETMLTGKNPQQVVKIAEIARNPALQVIEGLDFANVHVASIPGAVRFCVFDTFKDSVDPTKFATGYVTYVNGPMSPLYRFTEEDFTRLEQEHGAQAVAGLRNQRLITSAV